MDIVKEHALETYKFLMHLGLETLRLAVLLNGGALIALLAYLGNISSNYENIPDLKCSAVLFIVGLILAGFSYVFVYLMQLGLFNESLGREQDGEHTKLLFSSIGLIVLSIVFFALGAYLTIDSFFLSNK